MAHKTRFIALTVAGCALLAGLAPQAVRAQDAAPAPEAAQPAAVQPAPEAAPVVAENGRLFVEFKTATLYDAVQMVQQAIGRTDYEFADEDAAKATLVPSSKFDNAAWDNIIRRVTTDSGFKIVPQPSGKKSIEMRMPEFGYGGEGGYGGYPGGGGGYPGSGGGYPGGGGGYGGGGYGGSSGGYPGSGGGYPGSGGGYSGGYGGSSSGGYPAYQQQNAAGQGGYRDQGLTGYPGALPGASFSGGRRSRIQTQQERQTAPGLNGTTNTEGKEYRLLRVQHVYVGGIAKLFGDGAVISTDEFLVPDSALQGGLGGNGGFGGQNGGFGGQGGFGQGGFGGGFGGGLGGFGGGGFGGGGFGGGGFGGGLGGFGGGGFNNAIGGGIGF